MTLIDIGIGQDVRVSWNSPLGFRDGTAEALTEVCLARPKLHSTSVAEPGLPKIFPTTGGPTLGKKKSASIPLVYLATKRGDSGHKSTPKCGKELYFHEPSLHAEHFRNGGFVYPRLTERIKQKPGVL